MSLTQHCDAYLDTLKASGRSPRTVDAYRQRLSALVLFLTESFYPLCVADDLRSEHIQAYHDLLISRNLSPTTRRAYLATARAFLAWCQRHSAAPERNSASWIDQIEVPKPDRRLPPTPLSIEQVRQLIAAQPQPRERAILSVMYACGLRRSELIRLDNKDLMPNRGQLLVHGKGAKDRIVPIAPAAIAAIDGYFETRYLALGPDDPLFVTTRGRQYARITDNYLSTLFRRMPNPLGRPVNPHLLRHTFAVHLLRGGADVRHVQALLGHASPDTTNQYLGLVKSEIKQSYDRAIRKLMKPRTAAGSGEQLAA